MNRIGKALGVVAALVIAVVVALVSTAPARAWPGWHTSGGGGLTQAIADTFYCKLVGCTMTGATSYSGTNPDISTPGAEDLNLLPGSGLVEIKKSGGSSILKFIDGSGNTANITWTPNGFSMNNVTGLGEVYVNTGAYLGRTGNQTATTIVGGVHDGLTTISSGTGLFDVYGEGLIASLTTTKVITNPTDTATVPDSSMMNISATAAAAWTPSETGAIDGTIVRACNTGTFAITMTASAGVYQGPGSVLGQFDCVTFRYQTDRFVELAFSNN